MDVGLYSLKPLRSAGKLNLLTILDLLYYLNLKAVWILDYNPNKNEFLIFFVLKSHSKDDFNDILAILRLFWITKI